MKIGYLGTGNMGLPMARRLLEANYDVTVFDVRDQPVHELVARGARRAASPREMANRCDVVVVSLPTANAFRDTVTGPQGILAGDAVRVLVNTCTLGTRFVEEIVPACMSRGVEFIDCPISGGPGAASNGSLAIMVSGQPATIEQLQPLLQAWGKTIVMVGDRPGAAQVMKLVNNILFAVALVASSEAMVMGAKGGLTADAMLQVINNGSGRNYATLAVFPKAVIPRTFDFGATFDTLMKDVDLAIEQGESLGVPMWVCHAARMVLKHRMYQQQGADDLSRVIQIVEQAVGTTLGPTA